MIFFKNNRIIKIKFIYLYILGDFLGGKFKFLNFSSEVGGWYYDSCRGNVKGRFNIY
jgi:hypothetical protein